MELRKEVDTVIIGAGLTGLVAGFYLKKANKDFIILEKQARPGGVIQTSQKNGFLYEHGPNTGVLGTNEAVELFQDISSDCTLEVADPSAKIRYVLKNNTWHPLPSGPISGMKTPLFSTSDKFRILAEPFRKKGDNPHETLAELVKRRMGQSFLDYAVDPFILGIYAGDPNYLVPKYALPKLYNLEQNYGSFIGGAIKRKRDKEVQAQNKATREVFSVKGGLENLVHALVKSIGPENIRLNAQNVTITPDKGKYRSKFIIQDKPHEISSNKVITTTTASNLPHILSFLNGYQETSIRNMPYAKVVEVNLGFHSWNGFEPSGFGGLIPFKENKDMLGVLFMSTLFKNRAPDGAVGFTIFMGGYRKPHIYELPDDEIISILEKEFSQLMGIKHFHPDLLKIHRYENAIPQYGADMAERLLHIENIESAYPGLFIGGNIKDGIGMADRIKQGKWLANRALN
jgi:oxygen-dependent protoporphyrinogen oxidase